MRAVLTSVYGATAPTLMFTVLATMMHRTLALPPIQQLPSPQRPFIFIHPMKTGGSSLREVIRAGELPSGSCLPCTIRVLGSSVVIGNIILGMLPFVEASTALEDLIRTCMASSAELPHDVLLNGLRALADPLGLRPIKKACFLKWRKKAR